MFTRTVAGLVVVLACGAGLAAQDTPRIWQGVYTAAQAERGKAVFNTTCLRCHGEDLGGTTAPALKGDRFQSSWGGDVIESLFTKVRDTMPPNLNDVCSRIKSAPTTPQKMWNANQTRRLPALRRILSRLRTL